VCLQERSILLQRQEVNSTWFQCAQQPVEEAGQPSAEPRAESSSQGSVMYIQGSAFAGGSVLGVACLLPGSQRVLGWLDQMQNSLLQGLTGHLSKTGRLREHALIWLTC